MRARSLGSLLALAVLLAGCASQSNPVPSSLPLPAKLPAVPGAPIAQEHDHADPALHQASFGMTEVALAGGLDGPVPRGAGFGEVDINDGWAYVCRGGAVGGFMVVDVHDPVHPEVTGEFAGVGCSDIKVNDANDLVFYGTQRNSPHDLVDNPAPLEQKLPRGVYLVNVKDKAEPTLERYVPLPPNGVHTQHYVQMDGREVLFLQTYDWIPDAGLGLPVPGTGMNNPVTQRISIFEVTSGVDGLRDLRLLSVWNIPEPAPPGTNYFPHDITVQKHPLTGAWLGYIAYWDHGLVILNVDEPASPRLVSRFTDTSPSKVVQLHQARPFPQLIAGKHVTVLEPELQAADETGQFTLVDTTDPANPKRLGYWTLPGDLIIPGGFLFSPHNFNLANGRIYLAHNHAGVWVVDVGSAERLAKPEAVGFYQPHHADRADGAACQHAVWSAFFVDGYTYATDGCAGLVVLQFEGDRGLEGKGVKRVMVAEPGKG